MAILTVTLHPAVDKVLRVPALVPNDIARAQVEMVYCGGKGNNAARALRRLQAPVIASGFQGGYTGAFCTDSLEAEGIRTAFVTCQAPTRTSVLIQEDDTGRTFAIYEPGQPVSAAEIEALVARFSELLAEASLVLLCGSGQSPALADVYARMVELARQQGVRCVVDSSGEALVNAIRARPYMVKINLAELANYIGHPLPTLEAQVEGLMALVAGGVQVAAVSRGADGLLATDGREVWEGRLRMVRVVNVVGCGDALLAGMATALVEDAGLAELVRRGVACGAANTQVRGAGFIEADTVLTLLARVGLTQHPLPPQPAHALGGTVHA